MKTKIPLMYEPTPTNAPKFAAHIVEAVRKLAGVHLDYSRESMAKVDQLVEGMRGDGCTPEDSASILFLLGCYVGETLVRNLQGGRWINVVDSPHQQYLGFPLAVMVGDECLCNPIARVFRRLIEGEEFSLMSFLTMLEESLR